MLGQFLRLFSLLIFSILFVWRLPFFLFAYNYNLYYATVSILLLETMYLLYYVWVSLTSRSKLSCFWFCILLASVIYVRQLPDLFFGYSVMLRYLIHFGLWLEFLVFLVVRLFPINLPLPMWSQLFDAKPSQTVCAYENDVVNYLLRDQITVSELSSFAGLMNSVRCVKTVERELIAAVNNKKLNIQSMGEEFMKTNSIPSFELIVFLLARSHSKLSNQQQEKLCSIVSSRSSRPCLHIDSMQVLLEQSSLKPSVLDKLKLICSKSITDRHPHASILFRYYAKIGVRHIRNEDAFRQSIHEIFKTFRDRLFRTHADRSIMEQFFDTRVPLNKLLDLMSTLIALDLCGTKIQTNSISSWSIEKWRYELLRTYIVNLNDRESKSRISDHKKIVGAVSCLREFLLRNHSGSRESSIENVLQILVEDHSFRHLDFDSRVIFLYIVQFGYALKMLFNPYFSVATHFHKLFYHWREHISRRSVLHSDADLKDLIPYLTYSPDLLVKMFSKLKPNCDVSLLIDFFKRLDQSQLTNEEKIDFLKALPAHTELAQWVDLLSNRLVELMLEEYFPGYNEFQPFSTESMEPSAYNQFSSVEYCYTSDDLRLICNAFMVEYLDKLVLCPALPPLDSTNYQLVQLVQIADSLGLPALAAVEIYAHNWAVIAYIKQTDGRRTFFYKNSLDDASVQDQISSVLRDSFDEIEFIVHGSVEQKNHHDSGVFALANLEVLAQWLTKSDDVSTLENFNEINFTSDGDIANLRTHRFPELYMRSVCFKYKMEDVLTHHAQELDVIKNLLEAKIMNCSVSINNAFSCEHVDDDSRLHLSIRLAQKKQLLNSGYRYSYEIDAPRTLHEHILKGLSCDACMVSGNILSIDASDLKLSKRSQLDVSRCMLTPPRRYELAQFLGVEAISLMSGKFNKWFIHTSDASSLQLDDCFHLLIKIHSYLVALISSNWDTQTVTSIIKNRLNSIDNLNILLRALQIVQEYGLECSFSLTNIFHFSTTNKLLRNLHDYAVAHSFSASVEKDVHEFLKEWSVLNENWGTSSVPMESLKLFYGQLIANAESPSEVLSSSGPISRWNKNEIREWSARIRSPGIRIVGNLELVRVVLRAVELNYGFSARPAQILAFLCLLNRDPSSGRLAQINTGEGKTLIIAMLGAVLALKGHKVDVITTSDELAIPQAEEQACFYAFFNLRVSALGNDSLATENYSADVVYGCATEFQADILRQEFSGFDTRGDRKCDLAIVDEVDSMMIDGQNNYVLLSADVPTMNHLEPVLAAIWSQINMVASRIVEYNGKVYFKAVEVQCDESGVDTSDPKIELTELNVSAIKFIRKSTIAHVEKLLRLVKVDEGDDYPALNIPAYLKTFVDRTRVKRWVDGALRAKYHYSNVKHYLIVGGKIKIVDADNTGVVHANRQWSDGVHQFLQLKHGAKLVPESLTTNFISNVAYFKRYGSNLYGLTGTLGDSSTQKMLRRMYDLDCVTVPPFKTRQHRDLRPIFCSTESDWYEAIVQSCLNKVEFGRAALILTNFIAHTRKLFAMFKSLSYDHQMVKLYATGDDKHVVKNAVTCGEIIIATNIAGRGTDIKTSSQVELNGGLHVCVTFFPRNERVEVQNVGRTSRTGLKGTSQFVLFHETIIDLELLKHDRAANQAAYAKYCIDRSEQVLLKDEIFRHFCTILPELKDTRVCRAVKERFGFWLKMKEELLDEPNGNERFRDEFDRWMSKLTDDLNNGNDLIENPHYFTLQGNDELKSNNYEAAIDYYTKTIEADSKFAENAYYARAYAVIKSKGSNLGKNKKEIENAVSDLSAARTCIEYRLADLQLIQQVSSGTALSDQILSKFNLYSVQLTSIGQAIGFPEPDVKPPDFDDKSNRGSIEDGIEKGVELTIQFGELKDFLPPEPETVPYDDELTEMKANGYLGVFKIQHRNPIPWGSVLGLIAIGLSQIVIGGVITVFSLGLGSSFGIGLVTEGVIDIITAVKDGIINRNFSWGSWGIQKAISLAVSCICAGWRAMKDVAKTLFSAAKTVLTSGVKLVTKGAVVVTQSVATGMKVIAQKIGITAIKEVGFEFAGSLMEYISDSLIVPRLEKCLSEGISVFLKPIIEASSALRTYFSADDSKRNRKNLHIIQNKLLQHVNDYGCIAQFASYTRQFVQGIQHKFGGKLRAVMGCLNQLLIGLKALPVLLKLKKAFSLALNELEESEAHTDEKVLNPNKDNDYIIMTDYNNEEEMVESIQLQSDESLSVENAFEQVSRSVSDVIARDLCNILKGDVAYPCARKYMRNKFNSSKNVLNEFEKKIDRNIQTYLSSRRLLLLQNSANDWRFDEQHDFEAMRSSGDIAQMIDEVEQGGELGLPHLWALSEVSDKRICVLNEKGKVLFNVGPLDRETITIQHSNNHWTLKGGIEPNVLNPSTSSNDCLLRVIEHQTKIPAETLRTLLSEHMRNDQLRMAKMVPDILHLQQVKPIELRMGGRKKSTPLVGDYPSHAGRIKHSQELQKPLAELRNELNELQKQALDFKKLSLSAQSKKRKISRSHPVFPYSIDLAEPKTEMMMGVLSVSFNDGTTLNLKAVSGDHTLVSRVHQDGTPILADLKSAPKYRFVNAGKPDGFVYDCYNRKSTTIPFTKSCAAQKLFKELANHMQQNPGLEIKGQIKFLESYYRPSNMAPFSAPQVVAQASCSHCEKILPAATGAAENPK